MHLDAKWLADAAFVIFCISVPIVIFWAIVDAYKRKKRIMNQQSHWTEESASALAHRIAFDFIAQIENRMDELPMKQSDLARALEVTEGAVSKLLNNPQNLTIRTIAKYVRALGIKAAIVAYDDGDRENERGPVNSEIFASCLATPTAAYNLLTADLYDRLPREVIESPQGQAVIQYFCDKLTKE